MGLAEIIFATIVFIIIWFVVFKIKLMYDEKKPLTNIGNKIQEQDKKTFNIFGKRVKAGEVVGEEDLKELENYPEPQQQPERIFFSKFRKQKKEEEPKPEEPKPKIKVSKSHKKKVVKKAVKKATKKKK